MGRRFLSFYLCYNNIFPTLWRSGRREHCSTWRWRGRWGRSCPEAPAGSRGATAAARSRSPDCPAWSPEVFCNSGKIIYADPHQFAGIGPTHTVSANGSRFELWGTLFFYVFTFRFVKTELQTCLLCRYTQYKVVTPLKGLSNEVQKFSAEVGKTMSVGGKCCGSGMFISDPESEFFPSRIPEPNFFHPGPRIRIFSIPDPKQRKRILVNLPESVLHVP